MRLKLLISYVGTGYSGWQIQEKPKPPPTVQGALEAALRTIAGKAVRVHGSGRTDSGVHAHGQVAHCDIPDTRAGLDWRHSLNAVLPRDIRVLDASPAAPDFHARKDALRKTYVYQFWQELAFMPPHLTPFVWKCGPLNLEAAQAALPQGAEFSLILVRQGEGGLPAILGQIPHDPALLARAAERLLG